MMTSKINKYLIIVESPAKCKKIEEYLGKDYKCVASYGHLREIKTLQDIKNYEPNFSLIENKKKQVTTIKNMIKKCEEVIIATDNDREGESIGWHIARIFNLDISKTKRIKFGEITKSAIIESLKNPSSIDMDLVNAQKARQVLDMLIGFKVTPCLWKKFSQQYEKSLSAGRCQTPTLQLIYDNDKDIKNMTMEMVFVTKGYFTNMCIEFDLNKKHTTKEEILDFLNKEKHIQHIINIEEPKIKSRIQPLPLTTSKLQQLTSNEMKLSPKETMSICQKLYEGGHITYMRTDSETYSIDFINTTKEYITEKYTGKYLRSDLNKIEKKSDELSDAHEAIRPTNIRCDNIDELDSRENKVYKLIWRNTVASCMCESSYKSLHCEIITECKSIFKNSCEKQIFQGWEIVYNKKYNEEIYNYLINVKSKTMVDCKSIISQEKVKSSVTRFTEARVISLLEEKGIGRPSTYASLIEKIKERGYVKKGDIVGKKHNCLKFTLHDMTITEETEPKELGGEKNKLILTPLGSLIYEYLKENFNEIFNYNYTKEMELKLDNISCKKEIAYNVCSICDSGLNELLKQINMKKDEIKIDENNYYTIGKYGPIIKSYDIDNKVSFKPVKDDIDIEKLKNGEYMLSDIIKVTEKNTNIFDTIDGKDVIIKKGKYGLYALYGDKNVSLKQFGNRPIENINKEEIRNLLNNNQSNLGVARTLTDDISIRNGKTGHYIFYKKKTSKKPQFFKLNGFTEDVIRCDKSIILDWIQQNYQI